MFLFITSRSQLIFEIFSNYSQNFYHRYLPCYVLVLDCFEVLNKFLTSLLQIAQSLSHYKQLDVRFSLTVFLARSKENSKQFATITSIIYSCKLDVNNVHAYNIYKCIYEINLRHSRSLRQSSVQSCYTLFLFCSALHWFIHLTK